MSEHASGHGDWRGPRPVTVPATVTGPASRLFGGRCRLMGWSLTAGVAGGVVSNHAAVAAGATGNAALGAGNAITGFTVTMATVAAVVSGTVTVTNVVNGTQTYDFTASPSGQNILAVTFPEPIPASAAGSAPTVTLSAIVGGAAAHIIVYGLASVSQAADVSILDGGQQAGVIALTAGGSDTHQLTGAGIEIATDLQLQVLAGTVSGVLYIAAHDDPSWYGPWVPTK